MPKPHYEHRQHGKLWPLGIIIAVVNLSIISIAAKDLNVVGIVSTALGTIALIAVLLGASRLIVTVDADEVRVAFGFGRPRKRIARSDILGHEPVRNSWLLGWGIRWIKGGRMWNVWGLDAVELHLSNGKRFRIGSDEPKKLNAALRD